MTTTTRRLAPRSWHAGLVVMFIGAVSVLAGLVQTTVSSATAENCPTGATLVAKFEFTGGRYAFAGPDVNRNVMTLQDGSAVGANWYSTLAISAVVVAGGPGAITTSLSPMLNASRFTNAGLPSVDSTVPAIEAVQFCRPAPSPTTTSGGDSSTVAPAPVPTSAAPPTSVDIASSAPVSAATSTSTVPAPTSVPSSTTGPTATTTATAPHPVTTTAPRAGAALTVPNPVGPGSVNPVSTAPESTAATTTTTVVVQNTVAAPTTTVAGATTTTTVNPLTTGSTIPTTISPGGATSTSVYAVLAGLPTTRLPRTGSSSSPLIAIGIVLLGSGLGTTVVGSRRERGRA